MKNDSAEESLLSKAQLLFHALACNAMTERALLPQVRIFFYLLTDFSVMENQNFCFYLPSLRNLL